jgi:hypothetical protein
VTALFGTLCLVTPVSANHSITELVSTGPTAGYPGASSGTVMTSADGSRAFFNTADPLVAGDADSSIDAYERSGGTTTLISTGPTGGTGKFSTDYFDTEDYAAGVNAVSTDGSRVIFSTYESLTGEDEDGWLDIYERYGGVTKLLSTGPGGGNEATHAIFRGASADARHVIFETEEPLVPEDTENRHTSLFAGDLYERFNGTTTLVSTGPTDPDNGCCYMQLPPGATSAISEDGSHVFFWTDSRLVAADTDGSNDLYERVGGVTNLLSGGEIASVDGTVVRDFHASADGTRIIFASAWKFTPEDTDGQTDIYERSGGTTTLVSTSPLDTQTYPICGGFRYGLDDNCQTRMSADGSRIFFFTHEALAPEDTGGYLDLYEWSGGTVKLVSIGPNGGNGPVHVGHTLAISEDGLHAFFKTAESLVSSDTDALTDIYERFNNTTTLVSTGPSDTGDGYADGYGPYPSQDGNRVFWQSRNPLVPEDTNTDYDIYERQAGTTTLITPGTSNTTTGVDPSFAGVTPDGNRVFFSTVDSLVPEDTDTCGSSHCLDIYERRVASVGPQAPVAASTTSLASYDRLTPGDVFP